MKKLSIDFQQVKEGELSPSDNNLYEKAKEALPMSHSPYSNFRVGAAIQLANGEVVTGTNQENAAYPSGLCAERVAMFAAKTHSTENFEAILIIAEAADGELADAYACGSCRQVMLEYAHLQDKSVRVLMRQASGEFVVLDDVKRLLPFNFSSDSLKKQESTT